MQLLTRLRLCWALLRARRFVLFVPRYPDMDLYIGGDVPPHTWEAIGCLSMMEHARAAHAADARLLAAVSKDRAEVAAIEAEINRILNT